MKMSGMCCDKKKKKKKLKPYWNGPRSVSFHVLDRFLVLFHRRVERWKKVQTAVWPEVKGVWRRTWVDTGLCARRQLLRQGLPTQLMQAFLWHVKAKWDLNFRASPIVTSPRFHSLPHIWPDRARRPWLPLKVIVHDSDYRENGR